MKKVAIVGGTFSAEGRFTGKNASGQRFYIGSTLLAPLGITAEAGIEAIKFPIFILAQEEEYTAKTGENAGEKFLRMDAKSAFATMDEMLEASIADDKMDILANAKLAELAKAAGLPQQTLQARVNQAV